MIGPSLSMNRKTPHSGKAQHVNLQFIAEQLGLSRTTVSQILGGHQRYSEETTRRVMELAAALNYQPNRSAQAVRRGRSNLIGVLHGSSLLQVVHERAAHLGECLARTGYELLLADTLWSPSYNAVSLIRHMLASRIEGFIFSGAVTFEEATNRAIFDLLAQANVPAVLISSPHQPNIPAINADFETGFYDLTRHLLATGRRRLSLLLAYPPGRTWDSIQRYRGFCRAIEEAGGSILEPSLTTGYQRPEPGTGITGQVLHPERSFVYGRFQPFRLAQEAFGELLDRGWDGDGLLASNDEWAASVISVALRRGLRIPEDFAVTGYDNAAIATLSPVPITTVSQESEATCRKTVDLLLARMRGEEVEAKDYLIPCPLIIRESTKATAAAR